jgi:ADP-heptose:LPS heptosyltransferase
MFIISQMDGILTADTATFHISDAFMIPTVAIFTIEDYEKEIKYYNFVKSIFIKDESKNLSKFIFDNEDLTFYRFESWKKLKAKQIIKLLESF